MSSDLNGEQGIRTDGESNGIKRVLNKASGAADASVLVSPKQSQALGSGDFIHEAPTGLFSGREPADGANK